MSLWNFFTGIIVAAGLTTAAWSIKKGTAPGRARAAVAWTIGPPLYFICEWWLRDIAPDELSDYKQSQMLASQLWAAIAAVLGALYLKATPSGDGAKTRPSG